MTTEFRVSHVARGIERDAYARLFFEEYLNTDLCARLQLRRTLIDLRREGARLHREVEIVVDRSIATWVRSVVGDKALSYREIMDFDFSPGGQGTWSIVPCNFANQVQCSGTIAFHGHPHGATRDVAGHVQIRTPAIGGLLEKYAVGKVEESFAQAAELTNQWLAQHPDKRQPPTPPAHS